MATRLEVEDFSATELQEFLQAKPDLAEATLTSLVNNRVIGKVFLDLTNEDLKEVVQPLRDRKALKSIIKSYQQPRSPVSHIRQVVMPTYCLCTIGCVIVT